MSDGTNQQDPSPEWIAAADEELRQLLDEVLYSEKTHFAAAERLQRYHYLLGIISTVLAALASASIVSDASDVAGGLLALAAAVVSAILTFTKPESSAAQHLASGRQLGSLRVEARHAHQLDLPALPRDEMRSVIRQLAITKAGIDESSPGTGSNDYEVASKRVKSGVFDRDR